MKNRLKSLLSLLLVAATALSLAACGKSDDGAGDKDKADEDHPEFAYTAVFDKIASDQDVSLYPRVYTEDGFYSTSYEKIGNNTPEGVTPEYEGQYDVYGSFIYFVGFDGKVEKLANYQRMEPPANDGNYKDFNSSSDVSGICVADDGRLAVMEIQYKSWSEAPDGMDSSSNEYWEYYKYEQNYYVRWLESDGTEISSAPVEIDPDMYLDTYNMKLDQDGNLVCLYNGSQIVGIAPDGSFSYNIEAASDSYVDTIVKLADGTIAAIISSGSGMEVYPIDIANKKLSDTSYPLENVYLYNAITGSNGYDLYYTNGTNFYGLKLATGEQEKLFSWLSCDVNGNDMSSVTVRDDGSVVGVITDYDSSSSSYSYELVTVKQVPYESVPHKEIITLGCIGLQYQTQDMIVKFNRSNDKYRIEVVDYSEYNNEENGYDAGLTKLNTEIMAGNIPDILDISSVNYVQLASKGLIEDLYPYIDADEELNREDFFENVLAAMEVDGKLYAACARLLYPDRHGRQRRGGRYPGLDL